MSLDRRDCLLGLGASLGSVALTSLLARDASAHLPGAAADSRPPHVTPRAKSCIFLLMEGGPSHLDTFDPKPKLKQLHRQEFRKSGPDKSAMESGRRYYVESPFRFRRVGQSGADMATEWTHLPAVADELCFYRGGQAESVNHPTALYHLNTGNRLAGDPAIGAWVNYGLGSLNDNLPGFIVLPERAYPQGGAANWSAGFLPAEFQGTPLRAVGHPMLNLAPPSHVTAAHQRQNLDLLQRLNASHQQRHPGQAELAARVASYELAFRMQAEVPELLRWEDETAATQRHYGLDSPHSAEFGRKCLLARRMIERGVRFVQIYAGTWDSHDYLARAHGQLIRAVDQPCAALIADLKQRGLLDETLVIWCGEFGRSPDNGIRGGTTYGRDHNAQAMTIWLAGGGVRAGQTIGATDELGATAIEVVHPLRDLHVTLLHLLGLDDQRLTYFHGGRYKQLSQFGGQVIAELLT